MHLEMMLFELTAHMIQVPIQGFTRPEIVFNPAIEERSHEFSVAHRLAFQEIEKEMIFGGSKFDLLAVNQEDTHAIQAPDDVAANRHGLLLISRG